MAVGSSYKASIIDINGNVREGWVLRFDDEAVQPQPGDVFTGWTSDAADPANVDSAGGALDLNGGALNAGNGSSVGGVSFAGSGAVGAGAVALTTISLSGDPADTFIDANGEIAENLIVGETGGHLAFYGHGLATKQAVTGALSTVLDAPAKAVLTSIIAALVAYGLVTDSTT